MVRSILGVILGYVVMFAVVFATFSACYLAMGADRAFQPGSYEPSILWLVVSFVLGFIAAVAGGWICALVSRGGRAPSVLAAVVVALGLGMAIPVFTGSAPEKPQTRTHDVGNMEAMQSADTPKWVALVNPFLGAAGALAGARLGGRRRAATAA